MKRFLVALGRALLMVLYAFCRLFPRRNRIVCMSRQSNEASDDFLMIRACFEGGVVCGDDGTKYDVVILARKLENPVAYIPEMVRQVFYVATSRAVVLDSYCIVVSLLGSRIKAPVVQIWHALGNMKKFGYTALDTEEGHAASTAHLMHMHEGYDAVAVSSLTFAKDLAAGFNVVLDVVFEAALPRVDLLLDCEYRASQRRAFLEAHPEVGERKVIVYCPTFRKAASKNEREAMRALVDAIDCTRYCLVFKPHPVSTQIIDDERVVCTSADDECDPLYSADYVISDYSTVIYEAGLLDVPVFLYAYDWDEYGEKRSFNIDIARDVPTLFTNDARSIADAIERDAFDYDAYRAFVRENVALPEGETCTEHLCKKIVSLIDAL